jgi:YbbR domain-containing protein
VWLTVPLEYRNMSANKEIAGELVNKVEVGIRGPRHMISSLNSEQVRAHVDLSQATGGLNYIRLSADNIRIPLGLEITKFHPSTVRLKLENVKTRSIKVKPQFIGKLPSPLRLKEVGVEPPFVVLQGPESILGDFREIPTEPIDLSLIKENKKISVSVDIPSPQVHLSPSQSSQVSVDLKVERAR